VALAAGPDDRRDGISNSIGLPMQQLLQRNAALPPHPPVAVWVKRGIVPKSARSDRSVMRSLMVAAVRGSASFNTAEAATDDNDNVVSVFFLPFLW